ncbi:unnamed protein product, partial [Ectocarpus sp. 12 AP-2014]
KFGTSISVRRDAVRNRLWLWFVDVVRCKSRFVDLAWVPQGGVRRCQDNPQIENVFYVNSAQVRNAAFSYGGRVFHHIHRSDLINCGMACGVVSTRKKQARGNGGR